MTVLTCPTDPLASVAYVLRDEAARASAVARSGTLSGSDGAIRCSRAQRGRKDWSARPDVLPARLACRPRKTATHLAAPTSESTIGWRPQERRGEEPPPRREPLSGQTLLWRCESHFEPLSANIRHSVGSLHRSRSRGTRPVNFVDNRGDRLLRNRDLAPSLQYKGEGALASEIEANGQCARSIGRVHCIRLLHESASSLRSRASKPCLISS